MSPIGSQSDATPVRSAWVTYGSIVKLASIAPLLSAGTWST